MVRDEHPREDVCELETEWTPWDGQVVPGQQHVKNFMGHDGGAISGVIERRPVGRGGRPWGLLLGIVAWRDHCGA